MDYLVTLAIPGQPVHQIPLPCGAYVIGRGVDCALRLEDASVSELHAKLILTHLPCAWYLTEEAVSLRCSIAWNRASCLCPCCCPWRMGMHYSSDFRECLVDLDMCLDIDTWTELSGNKVSIHIDNNDIIP